MTTYKSLLQEVRTIKKLATQDFKEKLISLLETGDIGSINQAIELNEVLGLLTDQEIGDALIPMVIDVDKNVKEQWKQGGLGWFLLEKFPNNPMWRNLNKLFLRKNNLISLPKEIGNLKNLKILDLTSSNLTSLPKEISTLKHLKGLGLSANKLTSLPSWVGNLTSLEVLDLRGNKLTSLPKETGNLKKLLRLDLFRNNLTSLPKEIGNLTNLTVLQVGRNGLSEDDIPENLRSVTRFRL